MTQRRLLWRFKGVGKFEYESFLFSPELDHDKYVEVSLERLRLKFECQVSLYEEEIGRIEDTLEKINKLDI